MNTVGGLEAAVQCSSKQAQILDLVEDIAKLHEESVLLEIDSPKDFGCSRCLLKNNTFKNLDQLQRSNSRHDI